MSEELIERALAQLAPGVPLDAGDPRYVDLDSLRGPTRTRIRRRLRAAESAGRLQRTLLAGQPGTGKTTELRQLSSELQEWASVVHFPRHDLPEKLSFFDISIRFLLGLDKTLGKGAAPEVKDAFDGAGNWLRQSMPLRVSNKGAVFSANTELGMSASRLLSETPAFAWGGFFLE